MSKKTQWIVWFGLTLTLIAYLSISMFYQPPTSARTFLPGVTTHGHYQIELACSECHTAGMGVLQDACTKCHGEELKLATDTHPRSKFTDPGKAHLVKKLDGRSCVTCHQEHAPDRTLPMGLSLPGDYCWHCHQEVGEQRPSHADLPYDSCSTAGCHNYHDNRALYEDFLVDHYGEADSLDAPRVPERTLAVLWRDEHGGNATPLAISDADAPTDVEVERTLLANWAETAHAAIGVNCSSCHLGDNGAWFDKVGHESCTSCHEDQVNGFLAGRHGMRLSVGLTAMTPSDARLPMNSDNLHKQLSCTACHDAHRFDTAHAAVTACLECHNDQHSLAYKDSVHYELWQQEQGGEAEPGTGVSCATCHLPREMDAAGQIFVQHNQNNNLRPNEKMVRSVCGNCHGLQFSLDSLADRKLIDNNFQGRPEEHVDSIEMAKKWADERARKRRKRNQDTAED